MSATDPRYAGATQGPARSAAAGAGAEENAEEDTRSPEEIEADLVRTRAALTATVDELTDRVDPRAAVRRVFGRGPKQAAPTDDPAYEERRRTRALVLSGLAAAAGAAVLVAAARRR